ncbi:MAG: sulfite exporter TauE/SafE family protein [Rubrivivax sp.]|nr:sulfite exporter TauE/SafE family protein [Rubrivivax sp.]
MEASIVASAFALGLAGAPHCTAMCAGPCAALGGRGRGAGPGVAFHAARIGGYALAGGVAAAAVGSLASLSQAAPFLRPLWTLVHAALFVFGVWLMWQGRQPALLARLGRAGGPVVVAGAGAGGGAGAGAGGGAGAGAGGPWRGMSMPGGQPLGEPAGAAPGPALVPALAGALWFLWPCGLLQSALMVAALSSSPAGGAVAMAAFAIASSAGLLLAPLLWRQLQRSAGRGGEGIERWALRAAGAVIAGFSGWALTHGLWARFAAYCATL